jgi:hypothetical protein
MSAIQTHLLSTRPSLLICEGSSGAPLGSLWARFTDTKLCQGRRTVVQSPSGEVSKVAW